MMAYLYVANDPISISLRSLYTPLKILFFNNLEAVTISFSRLLFIFLKKTSIFYPAIDIHSNAKIQHNPDEYCIEEMRTKKMKILIKVFHFTCINCIN